MYTLVLSAVVTVNRMLVLYKAKRERENEIRIRQKVSGESAQVAQHKARNYFHRIKGMVQRFITIISYDGNLLYIP
jgi:hypothetical protein